MSVPVVLSESLFKRMKKEVRSQKEIVCLDQASHIAYLLVARELLLKSPLRSKPLAKIVKGF